MLAGCAEIAGLDGLGVGDATTDSPAVDATTDVDETADAADASDASRADGSDASDAKPQADASPSDAGGDATTTGLCTAPADCKSGQVCCETVLMSGTFYPCKVDADTVACTAASQCPTSAAYSCAKDVFRRCAAPADCTENGYPQCCTVSIGDASPRVCLSSTLAQLVGGSCL